MLKPKRIIVKVQVSLYATGPAQVLVYDEKRDFLHQGDVPDGLEQMMQGKPKQFFYARIKNGNFNLDGLAPWQEW